MYFLFYVICAVEVVPQKSAVHRIYVFGLKIPLLLCLGMGRETALEWREFFLSGSTFNKVVFGRRGRLLIDPLIGAFSDTGWVKLGP